MISGGDTMCHKELRERNLGKEGKANIHVACQARTSQVTTSSLGGNRGRRKEGGGYHTFVQNNWPIYIVVGRAGAGGVHVYSRPRPICARGEDNPICVAPHNRNMTMCELLGSYHKTKCFLYSSRQRQCHDCSFVVPRKRNRSGRDGGCGSGPFVRNDTVKEP